MFLFESLERTIAAMVHPDRRDDPSEQFSHRAFIASRLAVSAVALAGAPAALAYLGAPSAPVAAAFAFLMLPMAAALLASREGRLGRAALLGMAGPLGAAAALAGSGFAPAALIWLAALPVDAGAVFGRRGATLGAVAAALIATALALAAGGASIAPMALVAFLAPTLVYAGAAVAARRHADGLRAKRASAADAKARALTALVDDLVVGCDRAGAVSCVVAGVGAFGLAARDVTGRGLFERVHVADRPAFLTAVSDAAAYGAERRATLRLRRADEDGRPAYAWAELRCLPAGDLADDGATVFVSVRDVTDARSHAEELARVRADAERSDGWKNRFLANVSHELRTPLNAIIGFSDLLRSEPAVEDARRVDYADVIHGAGEHLLAMVNSLLDLSKIQAGRFELTPEATSLPPMVDQVVEMMRLRAEQGGVALRVDIDARVGDIVADRRACRQILTNLLANAVKFTREGGSVSLTLRPDGAHVVIEVRDTGVGIRADDLPRLGDAFFQANGGYDRSAQEGTGLGLSLVRGLVGLHGGEIGVDSAPGLGTAVSVRLPTDCREAKRDLSPAPIRAVARTSPAPRAGAASALEPQRRSA